MYLISLIFLFFFSTHTHIHDPLLHIDRVIIWGHKLHSHTHSYIHEAFFRAFKYLGYDTYWFDDYDDISNIDFSHSLFITEGQVDVKIPILDDCFYILHNCTSPKYLRFINQGKAVILQVFTYDCLHCCRDIIQKDEYIYESIAGHIIFMPWATNLLPYEIEENAKNLKNVKKENAIYYVGSIGGGIFGNIEEITPFQDACKANNMPFLHVKNVNMEEHISCIQRSFSAPTIVGQWQQAVGYIPCRVLKNVSYGQYPVTNSREINQFFHGKTIYSQDTYKLLCDVKQKLPFITTQEILELMNFVKEKHTYINRVESLLDFLKRSYMSYSQNI